jgi:hypothetical protein
MKPTPFIVAGLLLALSSGASLGQIESMDIGPLLSGPQSAPTVEAQHGPAYAHPALPPSETAWPGAMLIIVGGLFLAAGVIGPVVRANLPEELPDQANHDDHHADSSHDSHGHH